MSTLADKLGFGPEQRILIINCDGLGLCHSANVGVYSAIRRGVATSASLMVPCAWAAHAAADATPEDDIGVHLTLTSEYQFYKWGPITQAPSLLGGGGGFPRSIADLWDHADVGEVLRELRSQVERAMQWGVDVTHLDSHMQSLPLRPEFFDVYMELAVEFALPVRLPPAEAEPRVGFPFRRLAESENVLAPDQIVRHSGIGGRTALMGLLASLPAGVTELYLSPATDSGELRALTPDASSMVDDLELLLDWKPVLADVQRLGIELVHWRD
ncbi:MAG: ChbG/HpnK family deacetylase, partial [Microthrixaceae bacterium]|nr:ChbG/HpnK family deacetylase [Microthrixaceae bacterium]